MRGALAAVALLVSGLATAEVSDRDAGKAAFLVGLQAFRANQFAVAARSFELAYERDPLPEIAFSIAQANRRQYYYDRLPWRVQRAVQLYQIYLEKLPAGPRAKDAIDRLGELEPVLRELRQRGEIVPYVAPVRTELVVGADVEQAAVTIDGRATQLWEPVDVTPGSHEIVVDAPGFEVERRRVVIAQGRFLPIDIALRAKPGRLVLRTEPGATLYIDGRRIGSLPREDTRVVDGDHFVSITRRGRDAWSREVAVGRDQTLVVDADLAATNQRRAARWVLGGAATVVAASAGAALWSYVARRDARALDERRRELTATPADLDAYNERVGDARFRADLSLGLGISALVIGAVGAGMLWFDEPKPGAPPRAITPIVGRDGVGISLGLGF